MVRLHHVLQHIAWDETGASATSISRHMAPVDAHNSAIPGAIPQMGENLPEMWPNRRVKFHADR